MTEPDIVPEQINHARRDRKNFGHDNATQLHTSPTTMKRKKMHKLKM